MLSMQAWRKMNACWGENNPELEKKRQHVQEHTCDIPKIITGYDTRDTQEDIPGYNVINTSWSFGRPYEISGPLFGNQSDLQ